MDIAKYFNKIYLEEPNCENFHDEMTFFQTS